MLVEAAYIIGLPAVQIKLLLQEILFVQLTFNNSVNNAYVGVLMCSKSN